MKKFLLTSALVAASAASFAQEAKQSDASMISIFDASVNMTVDNTEKSVATPKGVPFKAPSVENETWYTIPGLYHRSLTKYSLDAGGAEGSASYSIYNAAMVSIPIYQDVIFLNMCADKVGSQWGFNNNYFGEEGYFDANNNGVRSASKHSSSTYYAPMVKSGDNIFFWGEEAYTSNSLSCDSVIALSYEEIGSNVKMYTGFTGNIYAFGTVATDFDFDEDGTAETVYQYGVEQSYPKPQAPISFDYVFIPALTYAEGGMFQNGAKIKMQIIGDESKKVLWEAEAGAGDFTNVSASSTSFTEYGCLKFQKIEKDEDGGEYTVNGIINEPYTILVTGFQDPGVNLGFRMAKRSTYGAKALSKPFRLYQDASGKAVGSLTWTANTYGLPVQLHGLYDVMAPCIEYDTSDGRHLVDMNVLKFSDDGQTTTAQGANYPYGQIYTQMDWYDAEGNDNYFAEVPEWVTSMTATMSETAKSGFVTLEFKAEPLPAGVSGRGAKVFIESFMGGIAQEPIYLLQGNYTKEMVDQATGVETIVPVKKTNKAITVNALGQRVAGNAKGLVIKNGVKVFNK